MFDVPNGNRDRADLRNLESSDRFEKELTIMNPHPPRELLEQTHSFPCKFMFKVIGQANDEFASRVVATVRAALNQDFDAPYELRETSGGRHVAVTIEPWVESSHQVIEIYTAIQTLDGLVMLM